MKDNKPWYEKIYIWIGIIGGIFTILGVSILDNIPLFKDTKTDSEPINYEGYEKEANNIDLNGDNNVVITGDVSGDININKESLSKPNLSQETETSETDEPSQFNFGQAMQHIYNNEEVLKKEIINNDENKPIYSSIYPGVSYWYISDQVRLIVVDSGFRKNKCSRTYYFDENEKLSFTLISDDKGEHRLYFYNDVLIRYIDESGCNYDINQNLNDHKCEWTKLALEESYEIFNGVKTTSEQDDFSVIASYDMNTTQSSISGIDVLVKAETSFPAEYVTISSIPEVGEEKTYNMHGGTYEWYFKANFYIKGTYTITVTAYNSDGESVSDSFEYIY